MVLNGRLSDGSLARRRPFFKRLPVEIMIIFESLLPVFYSMCVIKLKMIQIKVV